MNNDSKYFDLARGEVRCRVGRDGTTSFSATSGWTNERVVKEARFWLQHLKASCHLVEQWINGMTQGDRLFGAIAQSAEQAAHNRGVSGSSPDSATTHEDWCLIDKPECGPVHCTCAALRCKNCSHPRDRHVSGTICKVFACACEKFEGAE